MFYLTFAASKNLAVTRANFEDHIIKLGRLQFVEMFYVELKCESLNINMSTSEYKCQLFNIKMATVEHKCELLNINVNLG